MADYLYDAAGNQTARTADLPEGGTETATFVYDAAGRLSALASDRDPSQVAMVYDGRGFLRRAEKTLPGSTDFLRTEPVYRGPADGAPPRAADRAPGRRVGLGPPCRS